MKITASQIKALEWFKERGGEGILDSRARLMAQGEVTNTDPSTWLRLIVMGKIVTRDGRLYHHSRIAI